MHACTCMYLAHIYTYIHFNGPCQIKGEPINRNDGRRVLGVSRGRKDGRTEERRSRNERTKDMKE